MKSNHKKTKLAVIGAGAITTESYLPAARLIPNLEITHIVDIDRTRAEQVAAEFQVPSTASDYRELFGKIDAVVIATPPKFHARISTDFMNAGIPVLCEKPLAPTLAETKELVESCKNTGIRLAVAMNRRLSHCSQILKQLINDNLLGEITHFDAAEGYEYSWPLRTSHVFQNPDHRGIISDIGPHIFDLILWLFTPCSARIVKCDDDNWGGIEANACVELELVCGNRSISGQVEFSWTRLLRNSIRIYGQNGILEASILGGQRVNYCPLGDLSEEIVIQKSEIDSATENYEFVQQLLNFTESNSSNQPKYVPADHAIAPMELIEDCYRLRKISPQPWEHKWLESFFRNEVNEE